MCAHHQVILVNHQITDGGSRHVISEGLPIGSIIDGKIDLTLCAGIEQTFFFRVLSYYVHRAHWMHSLSDKFPGFTTICGLINIRVHIIFTNRINCDVCYILVKMASINLGDFVPGFYLRWSNISPGFTTIHGNMNTAIICASPN